MQQIARTPTQIGYALRRKRRQLGLTQASLGENANLRQATISALEAGEASAQLRTVCAILAALDLELVVRARTKGDAAEEIEEIF
ncbi:MAG TPA: helix-turn-helix domain-containing protein [Stellaceae bacterium]|jgi:HTH-type transcriptional regulator/antitoxin HipB|nr:helix-turn-helix domain-containing protein [Stellaceae bacterium]